MRCDAAKRPVQTHKLLTYIHQEHIEVVASWELYGSCIGKGPLSPWHTHKCLLQRISTVGEVYALQEAHCPV